MTIKPKHVGLKRFNAMAYGMTPNDAERLLWAIGSVQEMDVGKQVWETSPGVFQVESKDQMERRIGEEGAG